MVNNHGVPYTANDLRRWSQLNGTYVLREVRTDGKLTNHDGDDDNYGYVDE